MDIYLNSEHTCLLSTKEQLLLYWDYILEQINEINIIEKWYGAVYMMDYIPLTVVDLYKLKLECQDWRETDMKTDKWRIRIINLIITLLRLEKRFS